MSKELKEKRPRRPAARRTDIVLALIEERIDMIRPPVADEPLSKMLDLNVRRLDELLDELKRALNKNADSGEGE